MSTHSFVYPEKALHELFFEQVDRTPHQVAVIDGERRLTYSELRKLVDTLSFFLRRHGISRDEIVPIFMPRCVEFTIGYVAALAAGGAYLPLEVGYPAQQIVRILDECKPKIVLSLSGYSHRLPDSVLVFNLDDSVPQLRRRMVPFPHFTWTWMPLHIVCTAAGLLELPKASVVLIEAQS